MKRRAAATTPEPGAAAVSSAPARAALASPAAWLSNGDYRALVTARGGGHSACGPIALTRWRADPLADGDGVALFVRDLDSGRYGPACGGVVFGAADEIESRREPGRVVMIREVAGIETRLEIAVAHDAPCELRRLELRNRSERARRLDVTSFCEVALLPQAADQSHPAFSRLFVETEFVAEAGALLARRRPRAAGETWPVLVHALYGAGAIESESDRVRFIGRGYDRARPRALEGPGALSGSAGAVLDPALCLRRTIRLEPGGACTLTALLGLGTDRDAALELARRFAAPASVQEAFEHAAQAEAARWSELELDAAAAAELDALAAALLCGSVRPHPVAEFERDVRDAAERLTGLGLDPEAVRVVADERRTAPEIISLRTLERAARYWRGLGLEIECCAITRTSAPDPGPRESGVRRFDLGTLEPADAEAVLRTASLVLTGDAWPPRPAREEEAPGAFAGARAGGSPVAARPAASAAPAGEPLQFFNGYGGFNASGDEYVIRIAADAQGRLALPPRPWVNVIANEKFGFLFSETGAGCTWSVNSREHRITPWANDPLLDPHDELLYLRDDQTGEFWSPLPGPAPAAVDYEVRHGFGYSVCRVTCLELEQETCAFVPTHDPVKIVRLRVRNRGTRARRLSCFAMQSLVLGELRSRGARTIETGAIPRARR